LPLVINCSSVSDARSAGAAAAAVVMALLYGK